MALQSGDEPQLTALLASRMLDDPMWQHIFQCSREKREIGIEGIAAQMVKLSMQRYGSAMGVRCTDQGGHRIQWYCELYSTVNFPNWWDMYRSGFACMIDEFPIVHIQTDTRCTCLLDYIGQYEDHVLKDDKWFYLHNPVTLEKHDSVAFRDLVSTIQNAAKAEGCGIFYRTTDSEHKKWLLDCDFVLEKEFAYKPQPLKTDGEHTDPVEFYLLTWNP
mmetsp:Transcript_3566/g.6850  ORF Transcript_3566/g.6850 Transcript_3566/m.6850 type:complete len:218 (-) Transcript_3566:994-1647(-)|eukprot:CAMPEP_0203761396 /NCGR_PEP_ID=MMETSP0098-20131031/14495_1 /ASSEMBLY_ACC=CAM_ASM_000208 /TAXON_ID=96639 /ORGANISM=" , Strain NY0313808BC1" /LENGTH=217 /DNA_ID=CAMNT_0050655377 /DNA_START=68 /DNA_END=721 /DNA_ORIENTATION=-